MPYVLLAQFLSARFYLQACHSVEKFVSQTTHYKLNFITTWLYPCLSINLIQWFPNFSGLLPPWHPDHIPCIPTSTNRHKIDHFLKQIQSSCISQIISNFMNSSFCCFYMNCDPIITSLFLQRPLGDFSPPPRRATLPTLRTFVLTKRASASTRRCVCMLCTKIIAFAYAGALPVARHQNDWVEWYIGKRWE